MALLSRRKPETPLAALEREVSDLVARRVALEGKLAETNGALREALDQRRQSLLDSDLDDATAAARRDLLVRDGRDRVEALGDALAQLGTKIADAEQRLGELRDRAEREQIAAAVRAATAELETARAEFNEVAVKLVGMMQAVAACTANVQPDLLPQISAFIISEVPTAVDGLIGHARAYAAQTESGHAPIHRPAAPPPAELPEPAIERMRVYTLVALRWKEREQVRTAARYTYAEPPRALAERAIGRNLADLPDSDRAKNLIQSFGLIHSPAHPDDCADLESLDQPAPAESSSPTFSRPQLPEGMQERIGPARTGVISVNRA